jgi:hypothetical protein
MRKGVVDARTMGARISELRNNRLATSCVDSSYDVVLLVADDDVDVVVSGFWYERGSSVSRS